MTIGFVACSAPSQAADEPAPQVDTPPTLRELQDRFLSLRFGMFLHFNIATFANAEWATGHEDPALFQPTRLDCNQWAQVAKDAGMAYGVLTVKHTEGYPLWDSATTTHDITAFRNFRDGRADLVREFVDAFRAHGLRIGLYYCFPGDYSKGKLAPGQIDLYGLPPEATGPDDVALIKTQLTELLTNYGPIDLLWIDQYANPYTAKRWDEIRQHVKSLQPSCLIEGNNAHDFAQTDLLSYEFPWKPILPPEGSTDPAEVCDTIQKPSVWFWKENFPPNQVKTASEIVERLRLCNSRHANYLLNVPPDRAGRIPALYVERLKEVGELLRADKRK